MGFWEKVDFWRFFEIFVIFLNYFWFFEIFLFFKIFLLKNNQNYLCFCRFFLIFFHFVINYFWKKNVKKVKKCDFFEILVWICNGILVKSGFLEIFEIFVIFCDFFEIIWSKKWAFGAILGTQIGHFVLKNRFLVIFVIFLWFFLIIFFIFLWKMDYQWGFLVFFLKIICKKKWKKVKFWRFFGLKNRPK